MSRRKQLVEEYFDAVTSEEDWNPRYNIAPTQPIPVIRQNPKEPIRELSLVRWGLIPSWAKDPSVAARMINARSETASTKPAFRDAMKFRRCLIPTDGNFQEAPSAGIWLPGWVKVGSSVSQVQAAFVTTLATDHGTGTIGPCGFNLGVFHAISNITLDGRFSG